MSHNMLTEVREFMPDYKEMYLTLFRATERAVSLLIEAQQSCEECYLSQEPPICRPDFHKLSPETKIPPE